MKTDRTIPIVVGVTGHRKIRPEDYAAIFSAVKTELEKLKIFYPNSPVVMLNSLAEGGDLLCAEAAEELDIPIGLSDVVVNNMKLLNGLMGDPDNAE